MIHAVSRKINLGVSVSIDSVTPPSARSDEIDLVELFQKLWQQKLLIIGCTVLVSLCAVAYTFVADALLRGTECSATGSAERTR